MSKSTDLKGTSANKQSGEIAPLSLWQRKGHYVLIFIILLAVVFFSVGGLKLFTAEKMGRTGEVVGAYWNLFFQQDADATPIPERERAYATQDPRFVSGSNPDETLLEGYPLVMTREQFKIMMLENCLTDTIIFFVNAEDSTNRLPVEEWASILQGCEDAYQNWEQAIPDGGVYERIWGESE